MTTTDRNDSLVGRTSPEKAAEVQERLALLAAANKEAAARRAAVQAGKPPPPTPSIDELQRRTEEMTSTRSTDASSNSARRRTTVDYFVARGDGPWAPKKLSTIAYFYTQGLSKEPRISTEAFRKLLVKGGADLATHGWTVTLANGTKVQAVPAGEQPTEAAAPKPKRAPRKAAAKAPAKKAAARKPAAKTKAA